VQLQEVKMPITQLGDVEDWEVKENKMTRCTRNCTEVRVVQEQPWIGIEVKENKMTRCTGNCTEVRVVGEEPWIGIEMKENEITRCTGLRCE
jgi:hypothetical protein